jgi:hypothetical protein
MIRTWKICLMMLVLLGASSSVVLAQTTVSENTPVDEPATGPAEKGEKADDNASSDFPKPYITWGNRKVFFGLDFSFASVYDNSLRGSMGRERQIQPAFVVLSVYGDYNDRVSYRVEANPINSSIYPRPYEPSPDDRRIYFFPNQPDSLAGKRGVVSDPAGLYNVDDYKNTGLDPYHQMSGLRVGYFDFHTKSRRLGAVVGRFKIPQGLGLDGVAWFTAKDLSRVQLIDAAVDNGLMLYFQTSRFRAELASVMGNGSPFHDYGFYDFTRGEDKNSAVGTMVRGTYEPVKGLVVGGSVKHNYANSRLEDATTLHTSKRYDNAFTGFARWHQSEYLTVYGEAVRYKWGQRDSSAELMAGPTPATPLFKDGYYVGFDASTPKFRLMRLTLTYVRSELDRDDSLVAWASANDLYGAALGKKERSSIIKVQGEVGDHLSVFFFFHNLSNPFPELSAIKPIAGPGVDSTADNAKHGLGLRFRF